MRSHTTSTIAIALPLYLTSLFQGAQTENRRVGISISNSIDREQATHFWGFTWTAGEHVIRRVVKRLLGIFLVVLLAALAWLGVLMLGHVVWNFISHLTKHG